MKHQNFNHVRSGKIFLGILTLLPFILFAIYILYFLSFFFQVVRHEQPFDPETAFSELYPIAAMGILMALTSIALMIYYIVHVINNQQIDSTERIIWILVFLFAGMIGFPVYWYVRIWKIDPTPQPL